MFLHDGILPQNSISQHNYQAFEGMQMRTPLRILCTMTGCSLPKISRPCSGLNVKGQQSNGTMGNEHPKTVQNIPAEQFSVSHNINHVWGRCEKCSNNIIDCQVPEFNSHECAKDRRHIHSILFLSQTFKAEAFLKALQHKCGCSM